MASNRSRKCSRLWSGREAQKRKQCPTATVGLIQRGMQGRNLEANQRKRVERALIPMLVRCVQQTPEGTTIPYRERKFPSPQKGS